MAHTYFSNQACYCFIAHRPLMGQREGWICRPEGGQHNGILREYCGYYERPTCGLPFASVAAGRWRDCEYRRFSYLPVSYIDSPISKDMETLCYLWQASLGHSTSHRPRARLFRCDT